MHARGGVGRHAGMHAAMRGSGQAGRQAGMRGRVHTGMREVGHACTMHVGEWAGERRESGHAILTPIVLNSMPGLRMELCHVGHGILMHAIVALKL